MAFVCNLITYSEPTASEDNSTITRCFDLPILRNCGKIPARWIPCEADMCYSQPFEDGDILRLQYSLPDTFNDFDAPAPTHGWKVVPLQPDWLLDIQVVDLTDTVLPFAFGDFVNGANYFVAGDPNGNRWQGIEINPAGLPDCFAFKITLNTVSGEEVFITNPYERVVCGDTVKVEGLYPQGSSDCDGHLYVTDDGLAERLITVLGTWFIYSNFRRVRGQYLYVGASVAAKNLASGLPGSKTVNKRYKLTTELIPDYVADDIINALSAQYVLVNNKSYRFEATIDRNMEMGTMWSIDSQLIAYECNIKFNCF